LKYDAGQLLKLLREHCGAETCAVPDVPDVPDTTAVAADDACADPAEFDAVTSVRIVEPTSAATSVYVGPVTPMEAQLPPDELHRYHW